MKNIRRFIRHAKKITKTGNVEFTTAYWNNPYSCYCLKDRKEISRRELIQSYAAVTEFYKGPEIQIKVDGTTLQLYMSKVDDLCSFVDMDTGEVMLTLGVDCCWTYTTPWAEELYRWGKKGGNHK